MQPFCCTQWLYDLQVRSCTLDTWLPEQVAFMERTGNEVANAFWEARLQAADRPSQDPMEVERFIRRKVLPRWHSQLIICNACQQMQRGR